MATIRNKGYCPCPRCTIPLSKVHLIGTKSDRKARAALVRVDDDRHRNLISAARKAIYQQNYDVDSAAVERMLKPQSLVPTSVSDEPLHELECLLLIYLYVQNAFSD